ncbi:MAG TPA: bifunctional hydroxymethylpyrimidine kinase/phosphomethylpyrimidine kinase [Terriglobia bacterium]|nr:bifunctional hydroxymethylpyrimidine kinase/phosphomethylpyrimidine kinase [Terriglobia bacterium]
MYPFAPGARTTPTNSNHITAPPLVLTIAGFDPSGGAGIVADLKTFAAHNCYGAAAITALTVQNTQGVLAVHPVEASILGASLEALADDLELRAVKIGMLANGANVRRVAGFLKERGALPSVLDPVVHATSGMALLDQEGLDFLREHLLRLATVVTPNLAEAAALTGLKVESIEEMKAAARRLLELGARAVVVTGGHLDKAVDVFADSSTLESFASDRVRPDHTHGTGCTFSSAMAANLALGRTLPEAVVLAKAYVAESIRKAYAIGLGRLPLNHFYRAQEPSRSTEIRAGSPES